MGEFIKHPTTGKEIKIGVMDRMFYSKETLLKFKVEGYKGFYMGDYDGSLENALEDDTIYTFEEEPEKHDQIKDEYFYVSAENLNHEIANIYHNGYHLQMECKEKANKIIKAKIAGERWNKGQKRTIFACAFCNTYFCLDHLGVMLLRNLYPELKEFFNADNDRNKPQDLSLFETIELIADKYSWEDFTSYIGQNDYGTKNDIEELFKKYGYPTKWNFYLKASGRISN